MNEKVLLQAAMYNSYDVITHKRTIEDIEYDGMPVFVHFPDRGVDKTSLKVMVMYFIMAEEGRDQQGRWIVIKNKNANDNE